MQWRACWHGWCQDYRDTTSAYHICNDNRVLQKAGATSTGNSSRHGPTWAFTDRCSNRLPTNWTLRLTLKCLLNTFRMKYVLTFQLCTFSPLVERIVTDHTIFFHVA
eukprot:scaffold8397_cov134-Skeletonema_menzelii.AAC.2